MKESMTAIDGNGSVWSYPMNGTSTETLLCPDLLRLSDIGVADGWRGHVVRGFFHALRWITGL